MSRLPISSARLAASQLTSALAHLSISPLPSSVSPRSPARKQALAARVCTAKATKPTVSYSTVFSAKLAGVSEANASPSRLPVRIPKVAVIANPQVATRTVDALFKYSPRTPAPAKPPAGRKDFSSRSTFPKKNTPPSAKARQIAVPAGITTAKKAFVAPVARKVVRTVSHTKSSRKAALTKSSSIKPSPAKKTFGSVKRRPVLPNDTEKAEAAKPARVKRDAGSSPTPNVKGTRGVTKKPSSTVKDLLASGLLEPAKMSNDAVGSYGLRRLELREGYYSTVIWNSRYVPERMSLRLQPLEDTSIPFWSKFDKRFRNANPPPCPPPSAFFTRQLEPSKERAEPLDSCFRNVESWQRLELHGYTRPKKAVSFSEDITVRKYHVGHRDWHPLYIGQTRYRSAEHAALRRRKAMFDKVDGCRLTLHPHFVQRFRAVLNYCFPPGESVSDEPGLYLVERVRLTAKYLQLFDTNDGKFNKDIPTADRKDWLMSYWNTAEERPAHEPIPGPVQTSYGNGVHSVDLRPKLPRTIRQSDVMIPHAENPGLQVLGAFKTGPLVWLDVNVSES